MTLFDTGTNLFDTNKKESMQKNGAENAAADPG